MVRRPGLGSASCTRSWGLGGPLASVWKVGVAARFQAWGPSRLSGPGPRPQQPWATMPGSPSLPAPGAPIHLPVTLRSQCRCGFLQEPRPGHGQRAPLPPWPRSGNLVVSVEPLTLFLRPPSVQEKHALPTRQPMGAGEAHPARLSFLPVDSLLP